MEKEKVLAKASFYLVGVLARNFSSAAKVKWNWTGFSFSSVAENTHEDRRNTVQQYQGWDEQSNIKDGMSSTLCYLVCSPTELLPLHPS